MKNSEKGEAIALAIFLIGLGTMLIGYAAGNEAARPNQLVEVCTRSLPSGNPDCKLVIRKVNG